MHPFFALFYTQNPPFVEKIPLVHSSLLHNVENFLKLFVKTRIFGEHLVFFCCVYFELWITYPHSACCVWTTTPIFMWKTFPLWINFVKKRGFLPAFIHYAPSIMHKIDFIRTFWSFAFLCVLFAFLCG